MIGSTLALNCSPNINTLHFVTSAAYLMSALAKRKFNGVTVAPVLRTAI